MRTSVVVGLFLGLALVACDDDDKPAGRPNAASDSLWKMAPEGTRGALVVSPYSLGMLDGGIAALRSFLEKGGAELAPIAAQLESVLGTMGPLKEFSLSTLHLTPAKGLALFFVKDGMVAVLPVGDRAAFVNKAKGTPAATPDGVDKIDDKRVCKLIGPHYTCASTEALLATVGKSAIGERLKKLGARGDIEIVATELPLQGVDQARSSLTAAIKLERGEWVIRGLLGHPPDTLTAKLASPSKPRTVPGNSAGFAVFDIRQILESTEETIVEGVTEAQLVKSIKAPMTVDIPAGARFLDMRMELSDPKPMTQLLANCTKVKSLAALGAQIVDGVCRIKALQANLDLDLWIEGNLLRVGKKGADLKGEAVPMSAVARELAAGEWSMAFWGRGTMFSKQAKDSENPVDGINPMMATPIRALSMLNEVGFGVKRDGEDLRFLITMRTGFANPQSIVDKLIEIPGIDVLANKAAPKAAAIATANPASPFAADFAAGQHGLLIPTQMLDTATQIIIPALIRYTTGGPGPGDAEAAPPPPPPPGAMTSQLVKGYATLGYARWKEKNPTKPCPPTMAEFAAAIAPEAPTKDEWGHDFVIKCGKDLPANVKDIAMISAGPDGKLGTEDDIKSY